MEKEFEELYQACRSAREVDMFGKADYSTVANAARAFLSKLAYKIVPPLELPIPKIQNSTELYKYYTVLADYYYPSRRPDAMKLEQAQHLAKEFINSRMQAGGIGKERAIAECVEIMFAVFECADELGLTDIHFGLFGQGKFSWVTDKAVKLINKRQTFMDELKVQSEVDKFYADKKPQGWTAEMLDKAEKIIGGTNGKEEKS